jgi:hypothetical protein
VRKFRAEFDELLVELIGPADRPGALPFVLRELLTIRPLSVARSPTQNGIVGAVTADSPSGFWGVFSNLGSHFDRSR